MSDEVNNPTTPQATGAGTDSPAVSVPDKFKTQDGSVDVAKLSQAYAEVEKKATLEAQKRAELERAYQLALATAGPAGVVGAPEAGVADGRSSTVGAEMDDEPITARAARPVVQTLLTLAHPELALNESGEPANPEFVDGLVKYMRSLPPTIKQSIAAGDFMTTEWAVREYKALTKARTSTVSTNRTSPGGAGTPNFIEGNSAGANSVNTGTVYSKSQIRDMMLNNPREYARIAEDVAKAYKEGRVKE